MSVQILDSKGDLWRWGCQDQLTAKYIYNNIAKSPIQITKGIASYTVTFKDGDIVLKTETVEEGQGATEPTPTPTKEGYILSWDIPFNNVTSDLEVNAVWTAKTDVNYTVKYLEMETEKVLATEETKIGKTFNETYIETAKEVLGYTTEDESKTITLDEYNKVLTFYYTARNDTPYKVIHHLRNLDTEVEGYIEEEEQKTGTTDTVVTAEYKTLEGFEKNEEDLRTVKQRTVAGDGSLVLHLYYNKNIYNITYELNGGTESSPLTSKYTYGKEMILQTNKVTKAGYNFAGWYNNESLTGTPITSISATSTGDKTFYAKWVEAEKEYYILSEVYDIDLIENTITKVSPETNVTEFLSKIDTNGQMKVVNARGEEITDTSLVGTGYKIQVTFKGEVHTYEIAVRGDLDGNGKITTTDLSIINQQILHKIELTGIRAKAADTDYNGRLTTTDLSMINQAVLRKIKL